ncbi:MAG: 1-deoxy-D-xylulose-5-phosphate reductoisomerase [Planctomycetales bacterium]|nr:1-deoxy-D-xylulose-5-phosphate reductoisomerase [Planctomycetales bacterium]
MTTGRQNVAVLGSTGSIGRNALEVIAATSDRTRLWAISAHSRLQQAVDQARQFQPAYLVAASPQHAESFDWSTLPNHTRLLRGPESLEAVARHEEVDTVVSAIVGSAGLRSTWAALEAGKRVALANKETMVVAGPLINDLLAQYGGQLIPVDSEHSAVFQSLSAGRRGDVSRVVLTASGGPFRDFTHTQLEQVTVEQALDHPTWDMGPKITVDSATMMNKALEIIEARWLFNLSPEQISVVVHPQSVVHSMVEFIDGSVVAQLSPPDMKLPIQYALSYPERWSGPAERIDWADVHQLQFLPPDPDRFPALALGAEVARQGGTAGAVLNAANEAAVASFLQGELKFTEIVAACRSILNQHHFEPQPTLHRLMQLDAWARQEVTRWVCT